jgi:ADP-ribose pyrophosphatase YjhB (NUDIX family)
MTNLSHQLTENVKLLQKAVLIHQGEALLLKRSSDSKSRPEKWDLPGGNSEWPSENASGFGLHKDDISREIEEETTILVDSQRFALEELVFFDTFFDQDKQIFSIICGWKYNLPENFDRSQVKISSEHIDSAWSNLEKLPQFDFGGDHGEFVRQMIVKSLL